jgi:ribosome biogenesis GTPase / thiamine phosphate phosphatase
VPPTFALPDLGWTPELAEAFERLGRRGDLPGRVARVYRGGWVDLLTTDGELRGRQHPRFRRLMDPLASPAVGDWGLLRPDAGGGPTQLEKLLPRTTALVRTAGDADESRTQLVAANVDVVAVVVPADLDVNLPRIDRLLAIAFASGAQPVVLLSKADVADDPEAVRAHLLEHTREVDVHALSARTGEGLEALDDLVGHGRTFVLIGTSGAGKSTLANRLAGEELLATAELRADGAGRHTTTHRQLVVLPGGGLLIDTPGLRSIGTWDGEDADGETAFDDVEELIAACRFTDCGHGEEPGCAVREALEEGALTRERWERYRTIEADRAERARRRGAAEKAAETRRSRAAKVKGRRSRH